MLFGDTAQRGEAATNAPSPPSGERRHAVLEQFGALLGPLPTPASWGEEEDNAEIVTDCDESQRY